ncbi:hypothetical protein DBR40_07285 [Pedobacter sp. KBW01]|uniref:hypothetical protein n=1 Tax=Pedobacter sp. KBW01 TaxID=2153364 RepID=UPI000F99A6F8|nr:hypothetical protein [Pedobacter sp. KBW01]RQO77771.1 hypothetical protein DBR40_07285 [Pedobacter sp. KBW01]
MKNRIIKLAVLAIAFISLTSSKLFKAETDFSGKWTIDYERSRMADKPFPNTGKKSLKISQLSDRMVLEKFSVDSSGKEQSRLDTVVFDGKQHLVALSNGLQVLKTVNRSWSADGGVMTLKSEMVMGSEEEAVVIKITEDWKIEEGGRKLVLLTAAVFPDHTEKGELVYLRDK